MIDIEVVRTALAAVAPVDPSATFEDRENWQVALRHVQANAPTWLAWCVNEVERLQAERGIYFRYLCTNGHHTISRQDDLTTCSAKTMTWSCHAPMVPYDGDETIDGLVAERDAAIAVAREDLAMRVRLEAEIERLRAFISSGALGVQVSNSIDLLVAERDAALAENERLEQERRKAVLTLMVRESEYAGLYPFDEMTASREAWRACADQLAAAINNGFGAHITTPAGEALAEYERLRDAT